MLQPDRPHRLLQSQEIRRADLRPSVPQQRQRHLHRHLARGGTAQPLVATSRAAAFGDFDNDGGIDILVANRDAAPHLLRNVAPKRGHWLLVRVLDHSGRDAIGATLSIAAGARTLRRDVRTGYSYLAANDPRVHVGLGDLTEVESITVRWVDGTSERFGPFDADRIVEIRQGRRPVDRSARREGG